MESTTWYSDSPDDQFDDAPDHEDDYHEDAKEEENDEMIAPPSLSSEFCCALSDSHGLETSEFCVNDDEA